MMLIERAEQLKRELTDQWVIVKADVPELRRFDGLTGKVKTVNMNCRVLVQFDNPVDISWYDIDPDYLTVVDEPLPKKEPAKEEKKAAPAAKSAPKKATGGMSPLEAARAQGAGGAETKPAPPKAARSFSTRNGAPTGCRRRKWKFCSCCREKTVPVRTSATTRCRWC